MDDTPPIDPHEVSQVCGVEYGRIGQALSSRLQTLAVVHYVFVFFIFPALSVYVSIYLLLFTSYWWLPLLYGVWLYVDYDRPKTGGNARWSVKNWRLWQYQRDYFPVRLHKTVELDPGRNYVFGCHPHGMSATASFLNFATEATHFSQIFPGLTAHLLTLVGQFWYPLRRDYVMLADVHECSSVAANRLLGNPNGGHVIALVVGGASEILISHPDRHELILKKRRGFIKIAVKNGADLVPVYSFGEIELFRQIPTNPKPGYLKIQSWLKRHLGFPLFLFHGRGMLNHTFGLLPFRKPINTVVGRPIRVPQCSDPSRDLIDQLHRQYVDELQRLFEDNKRRFGVRDDQHLTIVA